MNRVKLDSFFVPFSFEKSNEKPEQGIALFGSCWWTRVFGQKTEASDG